MYNFRKRTIHFKPITCQKITVPEKVKSDEFKDEFEDLGDSDYSSSDSTSSEGKRLLNVHSIYEKKTNRDDQQYHQHQHRELSPFTSTL